MSHTVAYSFDSQPIQPPSVPITVYICGFIGSACSLIGCIFIISTFLLIRGSQQKFFFFLVVNMAIADIFISIAPFIQFEGRETSSALCSLAGFIRGFGDVSSLFWNWLISWTIYFSLVKSRSNEQLYTRKNTYLVLGHGSALILALIPLTLNYYGQGQVYCYFSIFLLDTILAEMITFTYTILLFVVIFLVSLYFYLKTIAYLKELSGEDTRKTGSYKFFYVFPFVLFLCNSGSVVCKAVLFANVSVPDGLYYFMVVTRQCQGILDALVYGSIPGVRYDIKKAFRDCFHEESLGDMLSARRADSKFPSIASLSVSMVGVNGAESGRSSGKSSARSSGVVVETKLSGSKLVV